MASKRTARIGVSAVSLLAVLLSASSAGAIVNGEPTGDSYAAVGTVVFRGPGGDPTFNLCSGFLISPTVFVTAGHCARDALGIQSELGGSIGASFDPEFDPLTSSFVAATSVSIHPDNLANPFSYKNADIGVLTLEHAISGVQPVDLPAEGAADDLSNGATLTTVGYGFTRECDTNAPGHCQIDYDPVRRVASETLISVSQWFLTVDQNPNADGTGGICLGDSGGPHLLAGTNTAVAVTTAFFSKACWSTSRDNRLDTPTALAFLRSFLPGQQQ
jgi:hypothetical protein